MIVGMIEGVVQDDIAELEVPVFLAWDAPTLVTHAATLYRTGKPYIWCYGEVQDMNVTLAHRNPVTCVLCRARGPRGVWIATGSRHGRVEMRRGAPSITLDTE
jgi:hypothetical protein